jgi:hypothetical protein
MAILIKGDVKYIAEGIRFYNFRTKEGLSCIHFHILSP